MRIDETQPTTIDEATYSHTDGYRVDIPEGTTLRRALRILRADGPRVWGDMGTMTVPLSDSTLLCVAMTPSSDCGWLLSAPRIVRENMDGRVVREYAW
jgi:hypothetical protein